VFEFVKKLNSHLGITSRPTRAQVASCKGFAEMGFENAVIEMAAVWCGQNNRRTYEDIEKKLSQWKEAGAMTVADIEEERRVQQHFSEIVSEIFSHAGVDRKITLSDIKFAKVWTALMPAETVYYAAECAFGTESPMKYINKMIQGWSAVGITTVEKAKQEFENRKIQAKKPERNYDQRVLTDEEFENGFYIDLTKPIGDESK